MQCCTTFAGCLRLCALLVAACCSSSSLAANTASPAAANHWSLQPPVRSQPPTVADPAWVHSPIDRFILARLESENLHPAPPADPRTLIRRLSFDLTGLPPTPEDVDAFVANPSPSAYETLVDCLLASPHFGERMAMYWLDVVRYADTNGIHGDNHRPHASFRDWVIKAFNDNMPFHQFVIEQLAGDLLDGATYTQRIASGFNRLNMTTVEGGAQPKEYTAIYQADRVRNTATIFLGMTLGCAQCHDHKYDPLLMRDFYRWAAFFADVEETAVGHQQAELLPRIYHTAESARIARRIQEIEQLLTTSTPALEAAQAAWEASLEIPLDTYKPLKPTGVSTTAGSVTIRAEGIIGQDHDIESAGHTVTISLSTDLPKITAVYLEALPDQLFPAGGPGRATNGDFVLNEIQVAIDDTPVKIAAATATHAATDHPASAAIDGDPATGWSVFPHVGQAAHAIFELQGDQPIANGKQIKIVLEQQAGGNRTIGNFRLWATDQPRPVEADERLLMRPLLGILKTPVEKRSAEDKQRVASFYRSIAPQLADARRELAELRIELGEACGPLPILVTRSIEPRTVRILPRGNWLDDSGEIVEPGVPAVFGGWNVEGRRATRLDLAKWLVAPEHPLVARVYVNRLWKLAFGRGLVRTMDDFGVQGAPPSHPELLDWLATEFIANAWDTKYILKQIVMSSAYRQSSSTTAEMRERDPENRLLARQDRFRLDAEMVRDNALAISGLLVPKLGGLSVKPYQPAGYWAHLNFPIREYQATGGADQYRRGLYSYWCRTFLHPAMLAFDAPTREECTVERPRSNTPLAALVLLNDPTYVEAARVLAARAIHQGGATTEDRIRYVFRQALERDPTAEESRLVAQLFVKHLAEYVADPSAAAALQSVGQSPGIGSGLLAAEQAAWTSVTRTVMNLNETIMRY